nr:helix-hairpin-helix domain-containing protein [Geodermatophilus sabuli]
MQEGGPPAGWVPDDGAPDRPGGEVEPDEAEDPDGGLPGGIGRHRAPGAAVRLDPGRRGAWALWAAGLIAAVLVAVLTWVDRPQVQPAPDAPARQSTPAPPGTAPATPSVGAVPGTSTPVVVSVVGLVARPGLVTLPGGSRVADAVASAGGLLPEADPASVNLAAVVTDGQQIAVGVPGAAPVAGSTPATGAAATGPVDLNAATAADLDALPGIGPVLAQRIVDHRAQHGRFTTVEQLDDVAGIGPAIYADLAELVAV